MPKFTCRAARQGPQRRAVFFAKEFFGLHDHVQPDPGAAPCRPPRTLNFCVQPRIMRIRHFSLVHRLNLNFYACFFFFLFFFFVFDKLLMLYGKKFNHVFYIFSFFPIFLKWRLKLCLQVGICFMRKACDGGKIEKKRRRTFYETYNQKFSTKKIVT